MGRGWGAISFVSQKSINSRLLLAASEGTNGKTLSELELVAPANLVQPHRLERLMDAAALAPHGLGDRSDAHPFLALDTMRARSKVAGRPL